MAEGTYEYECQRAELLGVEKPDYDEWLKAQKEAEAAKVAEEEVEVENIKAVESDSEGFKRVTSRLDELNNILSATQKKINNFKTSYGSLTNLFKSKVGYASQNGPATSETNHQPPEEKNFEVNEDTQPKISERKADLYNTMDSQVDKLDSMITKSENAHYSMEQQRKQMNKFLK